MTNRTRRQTPKPRCGTLIRVELTADRYDELKARAHASGLTVERQLCRTITQFLALRKSLSRQTSKEKGN